MIPFGRAVPAPGPRWHVHGYNRAEIYRLAAAAAWMPRALRLGVAARVGRLAMAVMPNERAAARAALATITGAVGAELERLTARLFRDYAMCFSDLLSTNREGADALAGHVESVRGVEHLDGLRTGVVSLTAHVGNWDLAGRLLAGATARPTHVVVAAEEERALERWLRRDGDGMRFVSRSHPTVSLGLLAALRRGEVVGMQGDRALGGAGDVLVPFFGRPAPFPIGPFRLAGAARVPVVPAFCTLGDDRRYRVTVHAPLVIGPGTEEDALRAFVGHLERLVAERPTQWFNFFDIWNPVRNLRADGQ